MPKYRYRIRYLNKLVIPKEKVSIIDVGSYGGFLDGWRAKDIDRTLSFDPIDNRKSTKKNLIQNCAIWNENKNINIYYTSGGGSDTLKHDIVGLRKLDGKLKSRFNSKPLESFLQKVKINDELEVQALTLDTVLETSEFRYDFLKIDVQGAEKQVLQGATSYLSSGHCLGLLIETYTIRMFQGQWLQSEVIKYLSQFGFVPVIVFPNHGTFGCSNDTLFIKKNVKSAKLNTILDTYGLLRYSEGFYDDELY